MNIILKTHQQIFYLFHDHLGFFKKDLVHWFFFFFLIYVGCPGQLVFLMARDLVHELDYSTLNRQVNLDIFFLMIYIYIYIYIYLNVIVFYKNKK